MTVLVTAANGNQGKLLIPRLLAAGVAVRACGQSESSAAALYLAGVPNVCVGDIGDPAVLSRALDGVHNIYYVGPALHPAEREMGFAAIDAARTAGVQYFVFSSVLHAITTDRFLMATIEQYNVANGATRYRVRYRTPENRTTHRRGFTTQRDAKAFAATVKIRRCGVSTRSHRRATDPRGDGPAWLRRQQGHMKPSAYRSLETAWRIHVEPRWGSVRLADLRLTDAQAWVSEVAARRGATVVRRAFGVLAGVVDDAVSDRRLAINPVRGPRLSKKARKAHTQVRRPLRRPGRGCVQPGRRSATVVSPAEIPVGQYISIDRCHCADQCVRSRRPEGHHGSRR